MRVSHPILALVSFSMAFCAGAADTGDAGAKRDLSKMLSTALHETDAAVAARRADIERGSDAGGNAPPFRVPIHKYLLESATPSAGNVRLRAHADPAAWDQWLDLKKRHHQAFLELLALARRMDRQTPGADNAFRLLSAAVQDAKYWTEDPKQWLDSLNEIIADIKRLSELSLAQRRGLAWSFWQFHSFGNFTSSEPVPFEKPGVDASRAEITQYLITNKDPLLRIAGLDIALRYSKDLRFAATGVETYVKEFPPAHAIHKEPSFPFPRENVEYAIRALASQDAALLRYGPELFEPMMSVECAGEFVYWKDSFFRVIQGLENGKHTREVDALMEAAGKTVSSMDTATEPSRSFVKDFGTFAKRLKDARTPTPAIPDNAKVEPPKPPGNAR
jgi:hypothetical protein